jgi:hypothetical protein
MELRGAAFVTREAGGNGDPEAEVPPSNATAAFDG